jgi:hypothetical protein
MAAGNTYDAIATQTLSSAAASVTFSSIAGTYTDLVLVTSIRKSTTGVSAYLRANNDSGTNYSTTYLYGSGTSAISTRDTNRTFFDSLGAAGSSMAAGTFALSVNHIMNYANSTTNKTVLARKQYSNTSGTWDYVEASVSLWRSTAAITQLDVLAISGNFDIGSTFSLYGIASA